MKSFLKFLAVAASILILSAVLVPILYRFLPFKFERIFNRLVMIFSLAAVVLFVRFRRSMFEQYGILWQKGESLYYLTTAFSAGILTLFLLTLLKIGIGDAVWGLPQLGMMGWILEIGKSLAAAFLIGIIEEFFFRGFIFSTLSKTFSWNTGISVFVTSLFYSLIHFVSHEKPLIGPEPNFIDSLKLVAAPFISLTHWHEFWPGAVGLFLLGLILNDLVIRTKSLYPAIGLHAGCVFYVKIDGLFVDFLNKVPLLFTSKKMYDGILGWVFLLGLGFILRLFIRRTSVERGML